MAIDYAAIAAGALEAIQAAGTSATLSVPGSSTYTPATGSASASSVDHTVSVVLLPPGSMKGTGMTFGQDIAQRAQAWALVAASGISATPAPGCKLTFAGTTYTVIGADTLRPAGVAVLHGLALVIS